MQRLAELADLIGGDAAAPANQRGSHLFPARRVVAWGRKKKEIAIKEAASSSFQRFASLPGGLEVEMWEIIMLSY
jgi:hypothetical protein